MRVVLKRQMCIKQLEADYGEMCGKQGRGEEEFHTLFHIFYSTMLSEKAIQNLREKGESEFETQTKDTDANTHTHTHTHTHTYRFDALNAYVGQCSSNNAAKAHLRIKVKLESLIQKFLGNL